MESSLWISRKYSRHETFETPSGHLDPDPTPHDDANSVWNHVGEAIVNGER
jgi:hypothetical protein